MYTKFMRSKFQNYCTETAQKIFKGDPIYLKNGRPYCQYSNEYKQAKETKDTTNLIEAEQSAYFDNFCLINNI